LLNLAVIGEMPMTAGRGSERSSLEIFLLFGRQRGVAGYHRVD